MNLHKNSKAESYTLWNFGNLSAKIFFFEHGRGVPAARRQQAVFPFQRDIGFHFLIREGQNA